MKLKDIYKEAVELGIKADPRGEKVVLESLEEEKKAFDNLKKEEKELYNMDKLFNPYSDTTILYDNGKDIKKVLVGIDIGVGELLLADRLNEKGAKIDAVIKHHPDGRALAALSETMRMQVDVFNNFGVSVNVSDVLIGARMAEVSRSVHPINLQETADTAKILDMNFACLHSPADNYVQKYLQELFDKKKPKRVSDVVNLLMEIPEYKEATKQSAGPLIFCGSSDRRAGKVMVKMTGGTGAPKEIYEKLSRAGVGTIVGMHISEESRKVAEENNLNVVIAGHISSDSIGMNFLMDELEKKGLEVVPCSGFTRVKRG